jgi:hypothetical protein
MLTVEKLLAPVMKVAGFRKKQRTWWRETAETVEVVNLQKSPYSEQMYVNLGVYIRSLGQETSPPEHRCHIRARMERVVPDKYFECVRSLEASLEPGAEFMAEPVPLGLEWLASLSTAAGRGTFYASPVAARCMVLAVAKAEGE